VPARDTLNLQVTGRGGIPASGVSAVVLNVRVTSPAGRGFVSVYGDGVPRSSTSSNLNFKPGQDVSNLVIAPVGANGKVAFYNGSGGALQLFAEVSGYYVSGSPEVTGAFGSLAPSRLLDTRSGLGAAKVPVAAHEAVKLKVAGQGGVPTSGVSAVVLNVTVTGPTEPGFVSVTGNGSATGSANVSFEAEQTVPNLVFAPVGDNGEVVLRNRSAGSVQLIADVSGYYRAGAPMMAGAFGSLAPSRLLDTQVGVGAPKAAVAGGDQLPLQVTGRGGVPTSGVSAVALNVTVAAPSRSGTVGVVGSGTTRGETENLTFSAEQTVVNLVIAPIGANGKVLLHNASEGTVHLAAEIAGYFSSNDKAAVVSAGPSHSCEVTTTGGVKCWGYNAHGELGDRTTSSSSVPVDVVGLGSGVKAVSAGLGYTCAVKSSGGVLCWGYNGHGELGDGTTKDSAIPVEVVGLGSGATAVSAGWAHSCAVTSAGAVRCWGSNALGQLGDGTIAASKVPVGVVGLGSGALAVGVGQFHSCAVTAGGAVKCWGYNAEGELGSGTRTSSLVPVGVVGLGSGVLAVSAGRYHSCAVTTAGAVSCWGRGPNGQLGNGTLSDSPVPVKVVGLGSRAVVVSAGRSHSCAVTSAGGVRCWGGSGRALGAGAAAGSALPMEVAGLGSGAVAVAAGGSHSCARSSAGAVRCWGDNHNGGLGNGTATSSAIPVDVAGLG